MDGDRSKTHHFRRGAAGLALALSMAAVPALLGVAGAAAAATHAGKPAAADVWIDASGASLPPYVGARGSLVYVVGNFGPATATGVTATFEIPAGLTATSPTGPCTTTATRQTCSVDLGSRFPGQAPRSSITVWADAPGSYTIRASVTADQPDPVPANNTETVSVLVVPAADLSVQVVESSDPAQPGRPLTFTMTVANNGPSPATGVVLTGTWQTTLRGGAGLLSFRSSQGACWPASGTALNCRLGGLASGGVASVTVTLRPRGTGTVTHTATVGAAEFDPDSTNNTDSETTRVGVLR